MRQWGGVAGILNGLHDESVLSAVEAEVAGEGMSTAVSFATIFEPRVCIYVSANPS
ncbi:hypothetical protein K445DRAFT_315010 [Daldinia sp. EC12]|nr:hypothetical protein K445DRAFT_315010 [Daldinia sp. EC12]